MTDPLSETSDLLESLFASAKEKQKQQDEAQRAAEGRQQRRREHAARRERLAAAFRHAYRFTNEERQQGRKPCADGFRCWAERFVELGKIVRECDEANEVLCLQERLRAVAARTAPAAMKFACALLLVAAEANSEAVASVLERANDDGELRRFVLWLPFILDHLWCPLPRPDGLIEMALSPDETSMEEDQRAEQALRSSPPQVPSHPAQVSTPDPMSAWPLVGERTGRRDPLPELARDRNRERQSRYCQGFDPDWWLPALLAAQWRTFHYPREASRASVQQWLELIDQMRIEYLGPFGAPERETELRADRENDLGLIREYAPQL